MPPATTTSNNWRSRHVLTFNGQFDTCIGTGQNYRTFTLADIIGVAPASRTKAQAPAFIPSSYASHDGRRHAAQREHGRFVALTGDIDKGDVNMADLVGLTRKMVGSETAIFVYSTGSATPDDKRWRIVVPLEEVISFQRWNDAQEGFFDAMQASGVIMDRTLARAAQPVFLPNVPTARRDVHGDPFFYENYVCGEKGMQL